MSNQFFKEIRWFKNNLFLNTEYLNLWIDLNNSVYVKTRWKFLFQTMQIHSSINICNQKHQHCRSTDPTMQIHTWDIWITSFNSRNLILRETNPINMIFNIIRIAAVHEKLVESFVVTSSTISKSSNHVRRICRLVWWNG